MLPEEEIREKYLQFKKDCPSGFLSRLLIAYGIH